MNAPRRRLTIIGAVALLAAVGVVALLIANSSLGLFEPERSVTPGVAVQVIVPSGATTADIAQALVEQGVIGSAHRFEREVKAAGADGKLRAGAYDLETGMASDALIAELLAGPAIAYTDVTIPEGWRITQIAARFDKEAGIPKDEFLALALKGADEFAADRPYLKNAYQGSLEGFLFPKTYRIKEGMGARDVIEMMLDQFDTEMGDVDVAGASKRGLSIPELVTAASIVERETKLAEERPHVSSVIRNRLEIGMPLQMCSTVVYVLNKNELRLTTAETKTESPYNTYLHKGLPPGPIASPGLASLKAAASPADTDDIYFVLTGKDGSHTFASNNAEFLRAKAKSKEVFGE